MSVAEKIKTPNNEIIQPKKMGLLVENPVYKPFRYTKTTPGLPVERAYPSAA